MRKKDRTKKDVCLRNGRLGFDAIHNYDKKDGVWVNGRIESRHIKVGLKQTVE